MKRPKSRPRKATAWPAKRSTLLRMLRVDSVVVVVLMVMVMLMVMLMMMMMTMTMTTTTTSWWFRVVFIFLPASWLRFPNHQNRFTIERLWLTGDAFKVDYGEVRTVYQVRTFNIYQWNGCVCCPNMLVLSAGLQHSIDSVMLPTPRSLLKNLRHTPSPVQIIATKRSRPTKPHGLHGASTTDIRVGVNLWWNPCLCWLSDCGWWILGFLLQKTVFWIKPSM